MSPVEGSSSTPAKPNFCPVCGDPVRPDERFCDKCGAALTPTAAPAAGPGAQVATPPQGGPVAFGAPTAGYPPAYTAPAKSRSNTGLILGCVALLVVGVIGICLVGGLGVAIFGGDPTPTPGAVVALSTATPIPAPQPTQQAVAQPTATVARTGVTTALRTALLGSVMILAPDDSGRPVSSGSGTILTPQGHILTNFHVIGDTDTGKYENAKGLYYVGISSPELNTKPDILYLAQVVKGDKTLDLAILRIVATKDGGKLPSDLKLTTVPVGDSDTVQIGDEISVIGFPSLGDGTVTFTRGSVSGFVEDTESTGTWIKTDTEINPGNSGGTAINNKGELVGIPTQVRFDTRVTGKIGKIRPINFAKSLIQLALQDAKQAVNFTYTPWSGTAAAPTPKPGTAAFSKIVICDEAADGQPVNVRSVFPSGTTKVTAFWTFSGMATDQPWGRRWLKDGQVDIDKLGQSWDDDTDGWTSYYLSDEEGLADGNYEFQLYLGTTLVQKATFTIQKATGSAPTPPSTSAGSFGKVVIAQDVTDAGDAVGPASAFPAGTTDVWAYFTYVNMKAGQSWGRKWLLDGVAQVDKTESWDKGATGWRAYTLSDSDGLTSGTYEFVLYLSGKEVQRAKFTIGAAARPAPTPTKPATSSRPNLSVTLSNPHYERWGKPGNADGCNDYNNSMPVRKFTMQMVVTNNTNQTVAGDWGPSYASNTGATLARCYYDYQGAATIPPGQTRNVTFGTFTNTDGNDWVSRVTFYALGGTWAWTLDRDARILTYP